MPEIKPKKKKSKADVLPLLQQKNKLAGSAYSLACVTMEIGAVLLIYVFAFILALFITDEKVYDTFFNYAAFSTQFVLIAFVLIFCKKNNLKPKDIGLRKPNGVAVVVLGVLFGFFGSFLAQIPESMFMEFLESHGYNSGMGSAFDDLSTDGLYFYITFTIVAILPAVFEELLFRGIILENTKHLGTLQACLINGLLFSLFHANPEQTGYTFIMGAVWALIAIRANSVIPTMLVHLVNNGYSVVLLAIGVDNLPDWFGSVMVICSLTFCAIGLWYFTSHNKFGQTKKSASSGRFWLAALPGLALNVVIWVYGFMDNVANSPVPPEDVPELAAKFLTLFHLI